MLPLRTWLLRPIARWPVAVALALLLSSFQSRPPSAEGAVLVQSKLVAKSFAPGYRLDLAYPEVEHRHFPYNHELNIALQRMVWQAVEEFRAEVEGRPAGASPHLLQLRYEVCAKNAEIISIRFVQRRQLSGQPAANPRYGAFHYDFSAQTRLMRLSDCFAGESPYAERIAQILLRDHGVEASPALLRRLEAFFLRPEGLALPLAEGGKECLIPWPALADLLKPHSAVAGLAGG